MQVSNLPSSLHPIVLEAVIKLTRPTDLISITDVKTANHYCLNERLVVIRDGVEYFISVKKVDVNGQEKKAHQRVEVDTDLPNGEKEERKRKKEELNNKKLEKIAELEKQKDSVKEEYKKEKSVNGGRVRYLATAYRDLQTKIDALYCSLK
jgi:hypothetical protein